MPVDITSSNTSDQNVAPNPIAMSTVGSESIAVSAEECQPFADVNPNDVISGSSVPVEMPVSIPSVKPIASTEAITGSVRKVGSVEGIDGNATPPTGTLLDAMPLAWALPDEKGWCHLFFCFSNIFLYTCMRHTYHIKLCWMI